MRRIAALIILLAALFFCLAARADLLLPYPQDTVLRLSELNETQQSLLDLMYQAVLRHDAEVGLPAQTGYTDASRAMNALISDFPELIELEPYYSLFYYENEPDTAVKAVFRYRLNAEEAGESRAMLLNAAERLVASLPAGDDFTRECLLYESLLDLTVYGSSGAGDTADGPLLSGYAVCGGYAKAFCLLMRLAGIPSSTVSGVANENHMWCVSRIDGVTCFQDPTWDDQDGSGVHALFYLNIAWERFFGLREITDGFDPSFTQDTMEFHRRMGWMAEDLQQAKEIALAQLPSFRERGTPIRIRISGELEMDTLLGKLPEWLQSGFHYIRHTDILTLLP